MKRKIKTFKIFKVAILFLIISLFLWNCEKEHKHIHKEVSNWKIIDISKKVLDNKTNFDSFLKKLKDKNRLKNKSGNSDEIYDFNIDYKTIREIILEDRTSYTFKVYRENQSVDYFENLVIISVNKKIQEAYLLKYTPTQKVEHIESHNSISFQGYVAVTKLDVNNLDFNYSEKTVYCSDIWVAYCSWSYMHVAGQACFLPKDGRISYRLETICEDDGFLEPPVGAG